MKLLTYLEDTAGESLAEATVEEDKAESKVESKADEDNTVHD